MDQITIIIPTIGSNPREYLQETLQSIIPLQSSKIVHQMIVFNNSKSVAFTEWLKLHLPPISKLRYVEIPDSLTMAKCWNTALEYVTTKWVLFLHDDDVLFSNALDNITNAQLLSDVGFITSNYLLRKGNKTKKIKTACGLDGVVKNTPKFVSTLINTSHLKKLGGFEDNAGYALDFLAFVLLQIRYGDIHVDQYLGEYRIHATNASSIERRNDAYGSGLPFVFSKLFTEISDATLRKKILFHLISFTYPHTTFAIKLMNGVARILGHSCWINKFR